MVTKGIESLVNPTPRIEGGANIYDMTGKGQGKAKAGNALLIASSVLLFAVAAAAMFVSFKAQYAFIYAEKQDHTAAVLESLILDGGAVIVAMIGLALALKGMSAFMCRVLNLLFIGASVAMNVFSADLGVASISVWAMAPVVYALTSDLLISNVRRLMVTEEEDGPIRKAKGLFLWVLRLTFHFNSTFNGFRAWTETLPVGPSGFVAPAVEPDTKPDTDPEPTKVRADRLDTDIVPGIEADILPAIEADTKPDTDMSAPDIAPDKVSAPVATVTDMSARKGRQAEALALMSARPDITSAELAAELGVSVRQARRYMPARKSA
ncbi:DUF2637 domain-containing protein [Actinocorallia aurantiaca]|uniref:DUF2637 domain-containing protein n=1 Tax=Actinocorallia aurantiaca TaxID=46204 RepID=A0ABP6GPM2_9ACTN